MTGSFMFWRMTFVLVLSLPRGWTLIGDRFTELPLKYLCSMLLKIRTLIILFVLFPPVFSWKKTCLFTVYGRSRVSPNPVPPRSRGAPDGKVRPSGWNNTLGRESSNPERKRNENEIKMKVLEQDGMYRWRQTQKELAEEQVDTRIGMGGEKKKIPVFRIPRGARKIGMATERTHIFQRFGKSCPTRMDAQSGNWMLGMEAP